MNPCIDNAHEIDSQSVRDALIISRHSSQITVKNQKAFRTQQRLFPPKQEIIQ
ncbi:7871_t:CDS:2, partial [Racocetra persica]